MKQSRFREILRAGAFLGILVILFSAARFAFAHAVLVESNPKAHQAMKGPDVDVDLKFNSRVDGARSSLTIVSATGGDAHPLALLPQSAPDHLTAKAAGLSKGDYIIRWQALSSDGHISRGQIPFDVQ